jgi:hypothetical protein
MRCSDDDFPHFSGHNAILRPPFEVAIFGHPSVWDENSADVFFGVVGYRDPLPIRKMTE